MEFVTGLRYRGGWSEEIFEGEEICGGAVWHRTLEERFPEGGREKKGGREENSRKLGRSVNTRKEESPLFILPLFPLHACVYFIVNVKTIGDRYTGRCYDKRYANIFQ